MHEEDSSEAVTQVINIVPRRTRKWHQRPGLMVFMTFLLGGIAQILWMGMYSGWSFFFMIASGIFLIRGRMVVLNDRRNNEKEVARS